MTDEKQEAVVFLKNGERITITNVQTWFCDMSNEHLYILFTENDGSTHRVVFRLKYIAGYAAPVSMLKRDIEWTKRLKE